MPIDISRLPIAEAPSGASAGVESGPLSQARKSHAAACSASSAALLTTVIHEYEMLDEDSPLGPTGIGAVAMLANSSSPMPVRSADSHQLAMMIIAVLPATKLSRNGPVVLASAVPICGSVTLT